MTLQTIISGFMGKGREQPGREIKHMAILPVEPEQGATVLGAARLQGGLTPLYDHSMSPVLGVGACRTGKSAGFVVPSLLSWRGSAVVHDARSELRESTSPWRTSQAGNRVIQFDPCTTSAGDKFNPVDAIRVGTDHALDDAQHLARCLIPDTSAAENPMWFAWARNELYRYLLAEACRGGSLAKVVEAVHQTDLDCPVFDVTGVRDEHPEIYAAIVDAGINPYLDNAKAHQAVLKMICDALVEFTTPEATVNTASSTFDLDDLADAIQPTTLYLVTRPQDLRRTESIRRVVLAQIVRRLAEKNEHRHKVLMMLDDFCAFGELSFMPDAVAFLRTHGVKCCITIQSPAQLEAVYGHEGALTFYRSSTVLAFAAATPACAMPLYEATNGKITVDQLMALEPGRQALLFTPLDGELSKVAVPMYFDTAPFQMRAKRG